MKNTHPSFYLHACAGIFVEKIESLLVQMVDKQSIASLTFFGDAGEDPYEDQLIALKKAVSTTFGGRMPLVTYIVQSLGHPDEMAVEVFRFPSTIAPETVVYKIKKDVRYVVFEWEGNKAFLTEGVRGASLRDPVETQSDEIFQHIESILLDENMGIHEVVRQWNYIGNITDTTNGIQNYQSFNNARARFYAKAHWSNYGYPAATGIGMSMDGIMVSLLAISFKAEISVTPLNNPLQVAAHQYSPSMLVGHQKNATPKFERAKVVQIGSDCVCFISGTAAIRGEQSMHLLDVASQTRQTIENIHYLLSVENMRRHGIDTQTGLVPTVLRVYFKKLEYLAAVQAEVETVWWGIPALYVQADICRPELLVEIEGIAEQAKVAI